MADTDRTSTAGTALHVVVVGAGVAGLGTALALATAGQRVTLCERDATPMPGDPDAAFAWDRRGAPQVRHSHALLARLRNLLRDRHPEVLAALLDAGATEMVFCDMMPPEIDDPTPQPGDEDLVALACRRTTFEWVLRRAVLEHPEVDLRVGLAVDGVIATDVEDGPPVVTGVRTTDAEGRTDTIAADLVVAAAGRRSGAVRWLAELGVEPEVVEEDTGIVYLSRFYRLLDGATPPEQTGPIGADLGYLKYAIFQGDNRTHSVTFAVRTRDDELRSQLLDPAAFEVAAGLLPATAPWVDPAIATPITEVHVMGGLLNRHIHFRDEAGEPLVLGLVAVGDAHTCSNPLYGRGCSLAMVQAELLADAVAAHGADLHALVTAYEEASATEIEPWYHAAVAQDRMARDAAARERARAEHGQDAGADPGADDEADPGSFMADVMREGLLPAVRTDAVVFRAFIRAFNLLATPDALMADADVLNRVMRAYQDRDQRPPEPVLGPPRRDMLAALAS